jgi:hypothetical protein
MIPPGQNSFWVAPASRGLISASRRNLEKGVVCPETLHFHDTDTLARQQSCSAAFVLVEFPSHSPKFGGTPNFTRETRVLPG